MAILASSGIQLPTLQLTEQKKEKWQRLLQILMVNLQEPVLFNDQLVHSWKTEQDC